jgi:mannobiose 2-epimerase
MSAGVIQSVSAGELTAYRGVFLGELQGNILPYWMTHAVERDGHGFYPAVDLDGTPVLSARKSSVLNARILWTFSAAATPGGNPEYAALADRAYGVVTRDFEDPEFGGYYMELASDNRVVNDIKHTYAQAFVLYSLCKYYEFRPRESVLDRIRDFFEVIEDRCKDPKHAGYRESFTRQWEPYEENRMADDNEPKSMNTHLHILEAYAALYHVWKAPRVQGRLKELLMLFLDRIIRKDGHLGIFFDEAFDEAASSKGTCSFGHDIEASWLLVEAAEILGNPDILDRMRTVSIRMADAVLREGIDSDGGLFLESTRFGSHLRTNKHWWLQAETLVGFMNAFELTGDRKYWEVVTRSWGFIDRHMIDHVRGEWFTKVNRLGVPFLTEPEDDPSPYYRNDWKIDPWKCPYHNGRAMLELVARIDGFHLSRSRR